MTKFRLSQNQKDTFFVLAMLETKRITTAIPVAKIKVMIESSRAQELDPSNFRKGIHSLAKRGLLDVVRANDLSLAISLNSLGRHEAAKIYRARTGEELDVMPVDDEQMTIFDNVVESAPAGVPGCAQVEPKSPLPDDGGIKAKIEQLLGGELFEEQREEFVEKFMCVVDELADDGELTDQRRTFEDVFLSAIMANEPRYYFNLRALRHMARETLNNL